MVKIIQEREKCIGCGTCAAICPEFWEMDERDAKANLIGGVKNKKTGNYELKVKNAACNRDAAAACPVNIIKIEK